MSELEGSWKCEKHGMTWDIGCPCAMCHDELVAERFSNRNVYALRQRLAQAEAENARLMRLLDKPFLEKLAELEAENKLLVDHAAEHERLQKQAEAALEMTLDEVARLAKAKGNAEAENARLRVCGTCGHMGDTLCWVQTVGSIFVEPSDPCHLTPSHWTPYWEET